MPVNILIPPSDYISDLSIGPGQNIDSTFSQQINTVWVPLTSGTGIALAISWPFTGVSISKIRVYAKTVVTSGGTPQFVCELRPQSGNFAVDMATLHKSVLDPDATISNAKWHTFDFTGDPYTPALHEQVAIIIAGATGVDGSENITFQASAGPRTKQFGGPFRLLRSTNGGTSWTNLGNAFRPICIVASNGATFGMPYTTYNQGVPSDVYMGAGFGPLDFDLPICAIHWETDINANTTDLQFFIGNNTNAVRTIKTYGATFQAQREKGIWLETPIIIPAGTMARIARKASAAGVGEKVHKISDNDSELESCGIMGGRFMLTHAALGAEEWTDAPEQALVWSFFIGTIERHFSMRQVGAF